jgi:hypothetical protein
MRKLFITAALLCLLIGASAFALPTDVPRILMVGDSWSTALQVLRSFEMTMKTIPAFEHIGTRGNNTTYVGVLADEFDVASWMTAVQEELEKYPTLDIVVLSLGGNDFVNESNWNPSMPDAQVDAFNDVVNQHISNVIDVITAVRPNIRIVLSGYDYVHHEIDGASAEQTNLVWIDVERSKLALAKTKERTYYLDNLGITHHYYGIPDASPVVAAGVLDLPGGYANDYTPFAGGDYHYYTPEKALLDGDIHLSIAGYDFLAARCISEYFNSWLAWPAVYEILPMDGAPSGQSRFLVTFSEAVTGVDVTDFVAGGAATVDSVVDNGAGSVYTVTISLNGVTSPGSLGLVDDDTIKDANNLSLGGSGVGNGSFTHNGALRYADPALSSDDDFDQVLEIIDELCNPYRWLIDELSFAPEKCDINGGGFTTDPIAAKGNGMLDTCELALLRACLRATTLDLSSTGGVTHQMVQDAWDQNLAQMRSDLGGATGRIELVLPGVSNLFAAFMTLGDANSILLPNLVVSTVQAFTELPEGVTAPTAKDYSALDDYLSATGDADGDGASNKLEYDTYYPTGGKEGYIEAALDPNITPVLPCTNSSGGSINAGESFCLTIPDPVNESGSFEWLKDGYTISDGGRINGSTTRTLRISSLVDSDEGVYECLYNNGQTDVVFGPVTLKVAALPVAEPAVLAFLILISACAGAFALRHA